jgi:hypothetical protein
MLGMNPFEVSGRQDFGHGVPIEVVCVEVEEIV